jgi:gas vesicle protein
MADAKGRFYWGVLVGGAIGFLLGTYLSTDEGRRRLDTLKARTVELTGDPEDIRRRASAAATTVGAAVGDALQEGISAARQRRQQLGTRMTTGVEPVTGATAPAGSEDA